MLPSVYLLVGSKPGLTPTLYPCLFLGSKQGGPRPLLVLVLVFVHIAISLPPLPSPPPPPRPPLPRLSSFSSSPALSSLDLFTAHRRPYTSTCKHTDKDSEREKLPLSLANTEIVKREWKREWKRDGGRREEGNLARSFLPLSLSLSARRKRHTLSRFLRSSVPLSSRFIRCIGRAWGVTNPSRIRIAAPTVGIRRAIGPNDTRKPNGKRKYDPDFRSVKRIRETPDRAGLLPVSPAHLRALYIHPLAKGGNPASSLSTPSLPSLFHYSLSQPHLFTVAFQWWKLDDWSRDKGLGFIGRPPFSYFHRKVENVLSLISPASSRSGRRERRREDS